MKDIIAKTIQNTAEVLYSRGLAGFDGHMQQKLLSSCALGSLCELYENNELKNEAKNVFLEGWFKGKLPENSNLPIIKDEEFPSSSAAKKYIIFIFYGIGMKEGDTRLKDFSHKLTEILKERNGENDVKIFEIAAFDDTGDKNRLNDGYIADGVQVVLRAYMPYNSAINRFAKDVQRQCGKNPDASVILIGYSGGGVVVTGIYDELKEKGICSVDKIIRIGSPVLKTSPDNMDKTVNLIIPGDPVPLVTFIREKNDIKPLNYFLTDITYDTLNPIEIHGLYFSETKDSDGIKNYEKTAGVCSKYIK